MPPAKNVRLAEKLVGRPNGAFHCERCRVGSSSFTGAKTRSASGHGRTGARKIESVRVKRRGDRGQNERAEKDFRPQGEHGTFSSVSYAIKRRLAKKKRTLRKPFRPSRAILALERILFYKRRPKFSPG